MVLLITKAWTAVETRLGYGMNNQPFAARFPTQPVSTPDRLWGSPRNSRGVTDPFPGNKSAKEGN